MNRSWWNFSTADRLVFGPGSLAELAPLARRHRWHRVLVISDPVLEEIGLVERICQPLLDADVVVEICLEGEPEPSLEATARSVEAARVFAPSGIVGLGGGSNIDLAKMTATLLAHGGKPTDYFGFDRIPGPVVPLVAIPTTAGTGSEVSHSSVLTDRQNQIKISTLSPYLRPAIALVDPALTYSCPRHVTADSGIDALTHAVEAYLANDFHQMPLAAGEACAYEGRFPLSNCLAAEAIRLVGTHLTAAVQLAEQAQSGAPASSHQARDGMALAATLAGMAFSNAGVALVHALEYPIGGAVHCSHGLGNGLLLPYVMQFNLTYRTEALADIARLLGCQVSGLSELQAAERAIEEVRRLKREIGIPERLREIGVEQTMLAGFAAKAFQIKRLRQVNPRPSTEADLLKILRAAY